MVKITLDDGSHVTEDYTTIDPVSGQQKRYIVIEESQRQKNLTRPLQFSYIHSTCGTVTKISKSIAETFAKNPKFYTHTFCCKCQRHLPLKEFIWSDDDQVLGT